MRPRQGDVNVTKNKCKKTLLATTQLKYNFQSIPILPSKHEILTLCWFEAVAVSQMMGQPWINIALFSQNKMITEPRWWKQGIKPPMKETEKSVVWLPVNHNTQAL